MAANNTNLLSHGYVGLEDQQPWSHQAEIKVSVGSLLEMVRNNLLQAHSGCLQNSATCSFGANVLVSLLSVGPSQLQEAAHILRLWFPSTFFKANCGGWSHPHTSNLSDLHFCLTYPASSSAASLWFQLESLEWLDQAHPNNPTQPSHLGHTCKVHLPCNSTCSQVPGIMTLGIFGKSLFCFLHWVVNLTERDKSILLSL